LAGDPFMWYMPVRHVWDLVRKFTMHYSEFAVPHSIQWYEWIHAVLFAMIFVVWAGLTLMRKTRTELVPKQILIILLATWGAAVCLLLTSSFQAVRYLYPIVVIAEVLLPLYILESQNGNVIQRVCSAVEARPKADTWSCLVVLMVTIAQLSSFLLP